MAKKNDRDESTQPTDVAKALAAYAEEIGKSEDELTKDEQALAMLNAAFDEPQAPDEMPAAAVKLIEEPKRPMPYETGSWKGYPQHRCPVCLWDTLNGEDAMAQQMIACRRTDCPLPPVQITAPAHVLVADKHGKERKE